MDYFIYSEDQINEKNEILKKVGKRFVPGTIIVNGSRQKFTQLSKHNYITDKRRYTDAKVIALPNCSPTKREVSPIDDIDIVTIGF